jgi:hypothetical protein
VHNHVLLFAEPLIHHSPLAYSTTDVISADSLTEQSNYILLIVIDAVRSVAFCFLGDANPQEITIKVSGGL